MQGGPDPESVWQRAPVESRRRRRGGRRARRRLRRVPHAQRAAAVAAFTADVARVPGGAGRHRTGLARATAGLDRRARLLTPRRAVASRQLAMPSSCGSATGRSRTSPTAPLGDLVGARTADEDVQERDGRERDTDPHRGVPAVHERLRAPRPRSACRRVRARPPSGARSRCLPSRSSRAPTAACSRRSSTPDR